MRTLLRVAAVGLAVFIAAPLAAGAADEGVIVYCAGSAAYLISPDGSSKVRLARARPPLLDFALSPDGNSKAWVRGTTVINHVYIQQDEDDPVGIDTIRGRDESVGPLCFSRDSSSLLYSGGGRVVLVDLATGEKRVVARGDRAQWLGDGPEFIYETGGRERDEEIGIHRATPDGELDELLVPYGYAATVTPDGRTVAYCHPAMDDDPRIYISDADGGNATPVPGSTRFDRPLALSGDDTHLLAERADLSAPDGAIRYSLMLFDLAADAAVTLHAFSEDGYSACFSPLGEQVCFVGLIDAERRLQTISAGGTDLRQVAPGEANCRSPHWYGDRME